MTVTPEPRPNLLLPTLESLASCLCAQIERDGSVPTCFCGVIPGDAAVGDYAGDCSTACGMAWVRLMTVYPATVVGVPNEAAGNCSATIGLEIEVGILRCLSIPEDGEPPSAGELLAVTDLQTRDAMSIWRAITCCDAINVRDSILSAYQPMGPMGGLVGGAYTVRTMLYG